MKNLIVLLSENETLFKNCCAKNLITLVDDKLFRCPYAANAHTLGAVPDFSEDYISLKNINENLVQKIRSFLASKRALNSCDFCKGRSFDDPEIVAGIQTNTPLSYNRLRN